MILLDAMGTLVGLQPPAPILVGLLAERHQLRVSEQRAMAALGVEMEHYRRQCQRAGTPESLAALRTECADLLAGELGLAQDGSLTPTLLDALRFEAYPEVPRVLAELSHGGEEIVVLSNWDLSLHEVLLRCGLARFAGRVITSAELGAAKPDALMFSAALAGSDPGAAVHVGDSLLEDVQGASACGIEAVLLVRADDAGLLAPGAAAGEPPPGVRVISSLEELL